MGKFLSLKTQIVSFHLCRWLHIICIKRSSIRQRGSLSSLLVDYLLFEYSSFQRRPVKSKSGPSISAQILQESGRGPSEIIRILKCTLTHEPSGCYVRDVRTLYIRPGITYNKASGENDKNLKPTWYRYKMFICIYISILF